MAGLLVTGFLVTGRLLNRFLVAMPASLLMHTKQLMQHEAAAFQERRTDPTAILQTTEPCDKQRQRNPGQTGMQLSLIHI